MELSFNIKRTAVENLRDQLRRAEAVLAEAIRECRHDWTPTVADHIYHPSYTIPGDPPGTMGVDWRGPTYVDAKTDKRWKRICRRCGEVEYTTKTRQEVTEHPTFD